MELAEGRSSKAHIITAWFGCLCRVCCKLLRKGNIPRPPARSGGNAPCCNNDRSEPNVTDPVVSLKSFLVQKRKRFNSLDYLVEYLYKHNPNKDGREEIEFNNIPFVQEKWKTKYMSHK